MNGLNRSGWIFFFTIAALFLGCGNYGSAWYIVILSIAAGHFVGMTGFMLAEMVDVFLNLSFDEEKEP